MMAGGTSVRRGGIGQGEWYGLGPRHGRRHVPGYRAGTGNSPRGFRFRLFEAKVSAQAHPEAWSRVASQA
jgi:hypothetical protein